LEDRLVEIRPAGDQLIVLSLVPKVFEEFDLRLIGIRLQHTSDSRAIRSYDSPAQNAGFASKHVHNRMPGIDLDVEIAVIRFCDLNGRVVGEESTHWVQISFIGRDSQLVEESLFLACLAKHLPVMPTNSPPIALPLHRLDVSEVAEL